MTEEIRTMTNERVFARETQPTYELCTNASDRDGKTRIEVNVKFPDGMFFGASHVSNTKLSNEEIEAKLPELTIRALKDALASVYYSLGRRDEQVDELRAELAKRR